MKLIDSIEILITKELKEFFTYRYQNRTSELVDEFLLYLHTKKEAYEINRALQDVKLGKSKDIGNLLNEL